MALTYTMWVSWWCNDIHAMEEFRSKIFICATLKNRYVENGFRVWDVHCFPAINFLLKNIGGKHLIISLYWIRASFSVVVFSKQQQRGIHRKPFCSLEPLLFHRNSFTLRSRVSCATQIVSISPTDLGIWVNMSNLKNASDNYLQYPLRFYFVFCTIFVLFGGFEYRPNNMLSIPPFFFVFAMLSSSDIFCLAWFSTITCKVISTTPATRTVFRGAAGWLSCFCQGFEHKYVQNGEPL